MLDGITQSAYYYARDHLGSIRAVVDEAGNHIASYAYDPFGRQTQTHGSFKAAFGFTGHYPLNWGGEELALAPFRAYDANLGQWLSRDPIKEGGGINLYAYVGNNPVNFVDRTGLRPTYRIALDLANDPTRPRWANRSNLAPNDYMVSTVEEYLDLVKVITSRHPDGVHIITAAHGDSMWMSASNGNVNLKNFTREDYNVRNSIFEFRVCKMGRNVDWQTHVEPTLWHAMGGMRRNNKIIMYTGNYLVMYGGIELFGIGRVVFDDSRYPQAIRDYYGNPYNPNSVYRMPTEYGGNGWRPIDESMY